MSATSRARACAARDPATARCAPCRQPAARLAPVAACAGLGGEPVVHVGHDAPARRAELAQRLRPRARQLVEDEEAGALHPGAVATHAARADQVRGQRLGQVAGGSHQRQPEPQVPVLHGGHARVERAGCGQGLATDQRRHHGDEIAADQLGKQPAVQPAARVAKALGGQPPLSGDLVFDPHVAVRPAELGLGVEQGGLGRQLRGRHHIVGIEEGDVASAGQGHPGVAGGAEPGVGLAMHAHAAGEALEHRGRVVGRAVVDDDDLGPPRLGEHALERAGQVAPVVVGRDHEAQARPCHTVLQSASSSRRQAAPEADTMSVAYSSPAAAAAVTSEARS